MSVLDVLRDLLPEVAATERAAPESYPAATIDRLFEAGVIAAPFEEARWTAADGVEAVRLLATASPSAALIASMPLGFAQACTFPAGLVPEAHLPAWLAQRDNIRLQYQASLYYAACNSEKGAGGAIDAIRTAVAFSPEGARITGEKILASGGRFAHAFFSTALVPEGAIPGSAKVEFFLVPTAAPGVEILEDWDGFGMRSTESQTVRYTRAPAELFGFPDFIATTQALPQFYLLFAAIPLGCAASILEELSTPAPASPALRLRFAEAQMRYEALEAYLRDTARRWQFASAASYRMRVMRCKAYVTQESTKLAAELFALSGGRHYRRTGSVARALADSFAGTALRPPLPLALDTLVEQFEPFES